MFFSLRPELVRILLASAAYCNLSACHMFSGNRETVDDDVQHRSREVHLSPGRWQQKQGWLFSASRLFRLRQSPDKPVCLLGGCEWISMSNVGGAQN